MGYAVFTALLAVALFLVSPMAFFALLVFGAVFFVVLCVKG